MKKIPALIVLLVLTALSSLTALDIYINNVLWHSYSEEALDALITEIPTDSPPSLPFALLLPLMEETNEMHLLFRGGDARLECGVEELRKARLIRNGGEWELDWDESRYHQPRRADLYGRRFNKKELVLWAEPGLTGIENQVLVWCSLHKLELRYREIEDIENELIHRRLTGEELPDLVLRFQPSQESFSEKESVVYLLRSVLIPGASPRHLVLPEGERFQLEILLSLLLSHKESSGTPLSPRFPTDRATLNRAREIYLGLILNHKLVEKSSLSGSTGKIYYPARSFPQIPGKLSPLPDTDGKGILPPRILPLQLKSGSGDYPAEGLLDFLRMPGIQHSLISLSARQLPVRSDIMKDNEISSEEKALYREWQSGYILSSENERFIRKLNEIFPDIYRAEGILP